ncbi:MAG: amino-acid N-acetyltransferase, partial [Vibrio sp.]
VNAHRNKTMVISITGEVFLDPNIKNIINDIALLHSLGVRLVLVYGARPQINQNLAHHQLDSHYHQGVRVTDERALTAAMQAAGKLQLGLTARLSMSLNNTPMAGTHLNVVSGNFITAQPLGVEEGVDFCHSGKVRKVDTKAIDRMLEMGSIVLLGPIASSVTGESFNLMHEDVALEVATRIHADKLISFSPEQGILNQKGEVIAELFPHCIETLLAEQFTEIKHNPNALSLADEATQISYQFLVRAKKACLAGVPRCHLVSYKVDGALIQELFSLDGIGTQVVMASSEQVRQASIDDIGGILDLIRPLEAQGVLVRRSREQLEQEIQQFTIIEKDNLIIGCAAFYPYEKEKMAEMACMAIHPDYRDGNRGALMLKHIQNRAKMQGITQIFVLTTHSTHWFREQGFEEVDIDALPEQKQNLYNYHRNSKILTLQIE